jgi:hypothetical protein
MSNTQYHVQVIKPTPSIMKPTAYCFDDEYDDFVESPTERYTSKLAKDVSVYDRGVRNKRSTGSCYNSKHIRVQQNQNTGKQQQQVPKTKK